MLNLTFFSFLQGDSERRPFAHDGRFHKDFALVVVFDDAFGQRETKTPTSLLARETWVKHLFHLRLWNALASIAQVKVDMVTVVDEVDSDFAFVTHGVDGVLG